MAFRNSSQQKGNSVKGKNVSRGRNPFQVSFSVPSPVEEKKGNQAPEPEFLPSLSHSLSTDLSLLCIAPLKEILPCGPRHTSSGWKRTEVRTKFHLCSTDLD